jgi:DNA-binding transcriptional LysR family regulator
VAGGTDAAIELRHLRYFLAVLEELHFGRAAERLSMTQPPLSQAIQKLEAELGVALLERTSRTVAPTEAGLLLAEQARKLLRDFDVAVTEVRRAGGAGLALRIGCAPAVPLAHLQQFLLALRGRSATARTLVAHLEWSELEQRLLAGNLDVGLLPAPSPQLLHRVALFRGEPLQVVLPVGHRLLAKPELTRADLHDEVLVLFPRAGRTPLFDGMLELLERAGYLFRDVHEVGGSTQRDLLLAVADGAGVTFSPFPLESVTDAAELVDRRPLEAPLRGPETLMAWSPRPPHHLRSALRAARDAADELAACLQ